MLRALLAAFASASTAASASSLQESNERYAAGNRFTELKRWDEATHHYRSALTINPLRATAWQNLGVLSNIGVRWMMFCLLLLLLPVQVAGDEPAVPGWWASLPDCFAAVALEIAGRDDSPTAVFSDCGTPPSVRVDVVYGDMNTTFLSMVRSADDMALAVSGFCATNLPAVPSNACFGSLMHRAFFALAHNVALRIAFCSPGSFVLADSGKFKKFVCEQCFYAAARAQQTGMAGNEASRQLYHEILAVSPSFTDAQFNLGASLQAAHDFDGGELPPSHPSILLLNSAPCVCLQLWKRMKQCCMPIPATLRWAIDDRHNLLILPFICVGRPISTLEF